MRTKTSEFLSTPVEHLRHKVITRFRKDGNKRRACITCRHFVAKTNCIFHKCKRCCGKHGSQRCNIHDTIYRRERRILLTKLQSKNSLKSTRRKLPSNEFADGTLSYLGDSCVIFVVGNFLCIPEVRKWLHRLGKGATVRESELNRPLQFIGRGQGVS